MPPEWQQLESREPAPDWVRLLPESRDERAEEWLTVWRQDCGGTETPQPGVSD